MLWYDKAFSMKNQRLKSSLVKPSLWFLISRPLDEWSARTTLQGIDFAQLNLKRERTSAVRSSACRFLLLLCTKQAGKTQHAETSWELFVYKFVMISQFCDENQNKPKISKWNSLSEFCSFAYCENCLIIPLRQDKTVIIQDSASCDSAFRTSRDISTLRRGASWTSSHWKFPSFFLE